MIGSYLFSKCDSYYNQQISFLIQRDEDLENKVCELEGLIIELEKQSTSKVEYDSDAYNYLAIGNSITLHEKCDYWWNEIGMGATSVENDYFHLVTDYLEKAKEKVVSYAVNYSVWEITENDREQTYSIITSYLSPELDLITIQLSENVASLIDFENDLENLMKYVQLCCPNAEIILIDDFWSEDKAIVKKKIAETMDILFVDLAEIRGKEEYKSSIGTTVYGDEGEAHVIEHSGVAAHPGDKGMEYIAEKIFSYIE